MAQAGARLPLTPELATEISRRTRPGEDHLGRTRIAATLGLTAPAPIAASAAQAVAARPLQLDQAAAATAVRVLAAVGPLTQLTLHRAGASVPAITTGQLAGVGRRRGDLRRPRSVAGAGLAEAPDRYRALVAVAAGRDLTRAEMV